MTAPRIIPTSFPLPHAHRMELPTWVAEKLREAFELGRQPMSDMNEANRVYAAVGKAGPVWAGYDPGSADGTAVRFVTIPARRCGKVAARMLVEARVRDRTWVVTMPFPGGRP